MEYEIERVKEFVKAGKALFTVRNENTGGRFTFKIKRADPEKELWFVSVLNGTDNYSNYCYIGSIFGNGNEFKKTRNSKVTEDAQCFKVFSWFWNKLIKDSLPTNIKVYHEGRCGRCGRRLTVPESIQSGFGPECINFI